MSNRPSCSVFWNAYLNYSDHTQDQVWKTIGGSIGKSYGPAENSCAARVSYGLNHGGAPIGLFSAASLNFADQKYENKAGDGKRYVVSAMQMAKYLSVAWGAPDHRVKSTSELAQVISGLGSKCAVFATPSPPKGRGHAGVLKAGYTDPYVHQYLPVDVWVLP